MSSIEDRLRLDARSPTSTTLDREWQDVIERAEARTSRARSASRMATGVFVLVVAAVALINPSVDIDLADGAADLAEGVTEPTFNSPAFSEPSPWFAVATWLLPWVGAVIAIAITYLTSPRDFRAPYLVPRISRAVAACSAAILWSGALIVITLPAYLFTSWGPLSWTYFEARRVFVIAFIVGGFLLVNFANARSGARGFWAFVGVLVASQFVVGLLPNESNALDLDAWMLALALLVAGTIPAFAIYTARALKFRPNWSRLSPCLLYTSPSPRDRG